MLYILLMKLLYLNLNRNCVVSYRNTSNYTTNTTNITNYITHNSNTILLTTQDTYNYYKDVL